MKAQWHQNTQKQNNTHFYSETKSTKINKQTSSVPLGRTEQNSKQKNKPNKKNKHNLQGDKKKTETKQ